MVRIGMLGCGFLATFYMQGLSEVPNQQVGVVYGRDKRRMALQADLSNWLPVGGQKREQNY
jgi:predicted dehydrogenase